MRRYSLGTRVTSPVSNMTEFEAEQPSKARPDGELSIAEHAHQGAYMAVTPYRNSVGGLSVDRVLWAAVRFLLQVSSAGSAS
jgi:hypothetical protein